MILVTPPLGLEMPLRSRRVNKSQPFTPMIRSAELQILAARITPGPPLRRVATGGDFFIAETVRLGASAAKAETTIGVLIQSGHGRLCPFVGTMELHSFSSRAAVGFRELAPCWTACSTTSFQR